MAGTWMLNGRSADAKGQSKQGNGMLGCGDGALKVVQELFSTFFVRLCRAAFLRGDGALRVVQELRLCWAAFLLHASVHLRSLLPVR